MQALEIKLQQTMSMIEFGSDKNKEYVDKDNLSGKGQDISKWLEKSTEAEWN